MIEVSASSKGTLPMTLYLDATDQGGKVQMRGGVPIIVDGINVGYRHVDIAFDIGDEHYETMKAEFTASMSDETRLLDEMQAATNFRKQVASTGV